MNNNLTKSGLEELKKELDVLVNDKRPKLVERLANARAMGDLSENADYQSAKEELEMLDGRIDELSEVIKNAVIVEEKGTKITVRVSGKEHVFNIVGEYEADPIHKKISNKSPLGMALLGKKKGDKVEVEAPIGKLTYVILKVE